MSVNGVDLRELSHTAVLQELKKPRTHVTLVILREKSLHSSKQPSEKSTDSLPSGSAHQSEYLQQSEGSPIPVDIPPPLPTSSPPPLSDDDQQRNKYGELDSILAGELNSTSIDESRFQPTKESVMQNLSPTRVTAKAMASSDQTFAPLPKERTPGFSEHGFSPPPFLKQDDGAVNLPSNPEIQKIESNVHTYISPPPATKVSSMYSDVETGTPSLRLTSSTASLLPPPFVYVEDEQPGDFQRQPSFSKYILKPPPMVEDEDSVATIIEQTKVPPPTFSLNNNYSKEKTPAQEGTLQTVHSFIVPPPLSSLPAQDVYPTPPNSPPASDTSSVPYNRSTRPPISNTSCQAIPSPPGYDGDQHEPKLDILPPPSSGDSHSVSFPSIVPPPPESQLFSATTTSNLAHSRNPPEYHFEGFPPPSVPMTSSTSKTPSTSISQSSTTTSSISTAVQKVSVPSTAFSVGPHRSSKSNFVMPPPPSFVPPPPRPSLSPSASISTPSKPSSLATRRSSTSSLSLDICPPPPPLVLQSHQVSNTSSPSTTLRFTEQSNTKVPNQSPVATSFTTTHTSSPPVLLQSYTKLHKPSSLTSFLSHTDTKIVPSHPPVSQAKPQIQSPELPQVPQSEKPTSRVSPSNSAICLLDEILESQTADSTSSSSDAKSVDNTVVNVIASDTTTEASQVQESYRTDEKYESAELPSKKDQGSNSSMMAKMVVGQRSDEFPFMIEYQLKKSKGLGMKVTSSDDGRIVIAELSASGVLNKDGRIR